jgi:hypothetical protein
MTLYTELRQTPKQKAKGITSVASIVRIPLTSYSKLHLSQHDTEHDAQVGFWTTTVRYDVLANVELDELVAQFADGKPLSKTTTDRHWFINLTPKHIQQSGKDVQLTYIATAQSSARALTATVMVHFRGSLFVGFDTD